MTIERWSMIDKPKLATKDEGFSAAIDRWEELKKKQQPGTAMVTTLPEGEFNLLPHYMMGKGTSVKMKVLEDGSAIILENSEEDSTVRGLTNNDLGLQIEEQKKAIFMPMHRNLMAFIYLSEDKTCFELHEVIRHIEGPNPEKEQIYFLNPPEQA